MSELGAQLHGRQLTVERSGATVLRDLTLTLARGDRIGLVGPNGIGKSTLLAALAGQLAPSAGEVTLSPPTATVGLLRQELDAAPGDSIRDFLAREVGVAAASRALDEATAALDGGSAAALEHHRQALDRWLRLGGADFDRRVDGALRDVGLDLPPHAPAAELSGGQRARIGLAALLLARYDVLLLDEPTNDLDRSGLAQLEEVVVTTRAPLAVVSHDRRFLERVVTGVVEIVPRSGSAVRYDGSFAQYRAARALAEREARRRYTDYEHERWRLVQRARRQRQWSAAGVRRQRSPSDNDRLGRGFRIEKSEQLAAGARRAERALDRLAPVDKPWEPWELQFDIGRAERSGTLVAELEEAVVSVGSFRLGPVSLTVTAGERLAIVGANGAGKTTLVQALFGRLPIASGRQRTGRSTRIGWLDQARRDALSAPAVLDWLVDTTALAPEEGRSVLAKFGLGASHVTRPVASLSPGERTRAVLARFQATGVNTLVLDEPTNHLDLPAIEQLEGALDRFEGTLVLITHDRALLDSTSLSRSVTVSSGRLVADDAG